MPIHAAELDANPLLLAVQNGVVDLSTGLPITPERSQLITKQAGTKFDPAATCPIWRSFLSQVTDGDQDLAAFLQRMAGYLLTGITDEQCLFLLLGPGANGKSVFLNTLQSLMGDYASSTPPETLLARRDTAAATPDLARLRGARLVVASEPRDGSVMEEALVKRLTGQDKIVCRDLYSSFFEYYPTFKFVLATNSKPIIQGTDHAIWRRIHLIPFRIIVPPERKDKQLIRKLELELPGILNWVLEGVRAHQSGGLQPPPCVVEATRSYRSDMDVLGEWIEEECLVGVAAGDIGERPLRSLRCLVLRG